MIADLKTLREETAKRRRDLPYLWTAPLRITSRWLAPLRRLVQRFRTRPAGMKHTVAAFSLRWTADRNGRRARHAAYWYCAECGRANSRLFDSCPNCDSAQVERVGVL